MKASPEEEKPCGAFSVCFFNSKSQFLCQVVSGRSFITVCPLVTNAHIIAIYVL